MKEKKWMTAGLVGMVSLSLLVGSPTASVFAQEKAAVPAKQTVISTTDVIKEIMQKKQLSAVYVEGTSTFYGQGKQGTIYIKRWQDGKTGKARSETKDPNGKTSYSVSDGKRVTMYQEGQSSALAIDIEADAKQDKNEAALLLEGVQKTHTLEYKGEEAVSGRVTYHLTAQPKDKKENTAFSVGDMEIWVDKETGFMMKHIVTIGKEMKGETVFTKVDFSPTFTEATFTLSLPKGIEVKSSLTPALDKVLAKSAPVPAYAESITKTYQGEKVTTTSSKTWLQPTEGKVRSEVTGQDGKTVYAVRYGNTVTMYKQGEDTATVTKINDSTNQQENEAASLLESVKETHVIIEKGEEVVSDRETYYLLAKAQNKKEGVGDIEIWVDKETGFVMKRVVSLGENAKEETVYTKVDFSPSFTKETFTLTVPKEVKVNESK